MVWTDKNKSKILDKFDIPFEAPFNLVLKQVLPLERL